MTTAAAPLEMIAVAAAPPPPGVEVGGSCGSTTRGGNVGSNRTREWEEGGEGSRNIWRHMADSLTVS